MRNIANEDYRFISVAPSLIKKTLAIIFFFFFTVELVVLHSLSTETSWAVIHAFLYVFLCFFVGQLITINLLCHH